MNSNYGVMGWIEEIDIKYKPFRIVYMGVEKRNSEEYNVDNSLRKNEGYLFQYTLSGVGYYEENGSIYEIPKGHAMFIKIPEESRYYYRKGTEAWEFFFLCMDGEGVEAYYKNIIEKNGKVQKFPDKVMILDFEKLFFYRDEGKVHGFLEGTEVVVRLLRRLHNYDREERDYKKSIKKSINYMNQNYGEMIGISDVAKEAGISLSHLSREFMKNMGIKPSSYLTNIRLQHSMNLLLNTSLSIDIVAKTVGFANGNYFSKVFYKQVNMSPREYRTNGKIR